MDMETCLTPLRGLKLPADWNDTSRVQAAACEALHALAGNPAVIQAALDSIPGTPALLALCEHYDILDKLVLHDDPAGFRVRLHVFLPGYFDRPHNHRWPYASTILRGSYRHLLFGGASPDEHTDPATLEAIMVREETAGSTYALHHSVVHAVVAEPYTVSLVIRGPAVTDRFLVMDRKTGESWWQHGAATETPEESAGKRMTADRFSQIRGLLSEWRLF
jgi:hypothetical protein